MSTTISSNDVPTEIHAVGRDAGKRIVLVKAPQGQPCYKCRFAAKFMSRADIDYGEIHSNDTIRDWWINNGGLAEAPMTLVFDADGNVVDHWTGVMETKIKQTATLHQKVVAA